MFGILSLLGYDREYEVIVRSFDHKVDSDISSGYYTKNL